MTFLSTLLALDKAATPGPWLVTTATWDGTEYTTIRCGSGADVLTEPVAFSAYESGAFITPEGLKSDAEIAVALRNSAPRLAAVIDAASMMPVGPAMEDEPGPYVLVPKDDLRALRDALFALDKEAP